MASLIYDPVLGWRRRPGVANAAIGNIEWTWNIGANGFRALPNAPATFRKRAWVFGCSFTEGQCLNVEDTFCYLLQDRFPDTQVTPFAIAGYSALQNLMQLEANLVTAKPDVVVFAYFHFHLMRNVVDPVLWFSRQAHPAFRNAGQSPGRSGEIFRPAGELSARGRLRYRRVYMPRSDAELDGMCAYRPDEYTKHRVAELIYRRARRLTEEAGGAFHVAVLRSGGSIEHGGVSPVPVMEDPFIALLAENGISIIDADPNLPLEETSFAPLDTHPNAAANRHFARCIGDALAAEL